MTRCTALLVVDRRFIEIDGGTYTEGPIGAETGGRYLRWFDRVIVAGRRGIRNASTRGLTNITQPGLEIRYLPDLSGLGRRLRSADDARAALDRLYAEADAVIARLPSELGVEAAVLAQRLDKPLALDVGGCVLDGMRAHGSLAGKVYAPVAYRRMRSVVRRAAWVSYVTQHFLQERYPAMEGVRTVACSNVDLPEPVQDVLAARFARIATESGPLTFGTIGSLYGDFKGIQHAIAAFGRVGSRLPHFRYRVLGGGDPAPWRRLAVQHGVADRVVFDGALPAGQAVLDWLDGVDVYLQPSLREGLPRALIEAMSRGCPAVASDLAGIPELLPRELLHPPGDVAALAALIESIARASASVRREQARRNWELARRYAGSVLQQVRDGFWGAFRASLRPSS
jgi:glycosyltransferase involved in cell wall biosynthesis